MSDINEDIDITDEGSEVVEGNDAKDRPDVRSKKLRINIHVILIAAIVIILGIAGYELYRWNHGEVLNFDPNEDTSEFDVEVLDEIIAMNPADYEGHKFDDETTVLLLGNGAVAFTRDDENGIAKRIADSAGATVYNASFPYPTLATRNLAMIEQNYPDDIYSLTYLADAMCTGDFSEIDRVTQTYHADGNFTQDAVRTLKNVDYDNLDVIVIMYDASDYFEKRAIENPKDDEERCTIVGSLNYAIRRIHKAYPYVRIIVSSLYYAPGKNDDGSVYDPDIVDHGNGTISNYFYNELNTCVELSVSFLDNFYGTINQDNYKDYIDTESEEDYIVLNDKGQQALADRIAYAIRLYQHDR